MENSLKTSRPQAVPDTKRSGEYFTHVEGTRALAVLLVVVYHVFTERSAGAVDVFFVLTGLLVVSSLMRRFDRGLSGIGDFLKGLFLRLFPVSLVVLLLTAVGSLLLIPPANLLVANRQIIASALYYQNWQLIVQGADYLDRDEPDSPVIHFWAMSVQMQFYLATALIFALIVIFASKVVSQDKLRSVLATIFGVIFVISFAYSIYLTHFVNSEWAYFDTPARAWEFSMGALLALALNRWPALSIHRVWGWIGIGGLFAAGAVVGAVLPFPGFAALAPTVSTVLIILAAREKTGGSASVVLSNPVMVSLGGVAYTLYLVHWPILIFYRLGISETVSFFAGLGIIAVSIAASYLLRFGVEKPLLARKYGLQSGRLLALTTIPLLVASVGIPGAWLVRTNLAVSGGDTWGSADTLVNNPPIGQWYPSTVDPDRLVPPFDLIWYSKPDSYQDRTADGIICHSPNSDREEAGWCVYGETDQPVLTVAMVGSSHVAQWLPALDYIAKERGWRLMYMTASACRFKKDNPELDAENRAECTEVTQRMLEGLLEISPDFVFTDANIGSEDRPPAERIAYWQELSDAAIPIIAIRDNPGFTFAPSSCLSEHLDDPLACATPRDDVLAKTFATDNLPEQVRVIDLTENYCDVDYCPAIIGDVLVWRDPSHFTKQFILTMTRPLEAAIDDVWSEPSESSANQAAIERLLSPRE